MSACETFGVSGPAGVYDALQKVDCLASNATAVSFGRLFGEHGAFQSALTIMLTIYVALLAVNLLTGRSALRLSVFTPKMIKMGLILTFVTSWVAYQSVVWNLAVGAPDEIASVLVGTKQSATMLFAQRLDLLFDAITAAADAIPSETAPEPMFASPANILSLAALILLIGTVGVLVVCRLALAALLILGPVFIVLALFDGTRGLFEGWLKSVVMFALVPLLTVLIGSGALVAIMPMVAGLGVGRDIPLQSAVSILVAAIIYLGLMFVVSKVATMLTQGWRLSRDRMASGAVQYRDGVQAAAQQPHSSSDRLTILNSADRVRTAVASLRTTIAGNSHPAAQLGGSARAGRLSLMTSGAGFNEMGPKHGLQLHRRTHGISPDMPREILR